MGEIVSPATEACDAQKWFLAQLKPNAWRIAERNLRRQDFTVFNPLEERTVSRRGRFVAEKRPLFPGYLFVGFDPDSAPWRAINSTYGVARLVTFEANRPRVVPTALVEAIMARCDSEARLIPPDRLTPGTEVRFATGPFTQFVATVEAIAPDKRIWVMLEVMGRETRVLANPDAVQRI
jgi:transcriptional antiterminator RfaH